MQCCWINKRARVTHTTGREGGDRLSRARAHVRNDFGEPRVNPPRQNDDFEIPSRSALNVRSLVFLSVFFFLILFVEFP